MAKEELLEPDLAEPYKAWKSNPTPQAGSAMLKAVDPIINEAVRSFGGGSAASPTLKGKAKQLTLQALANYDPSRAKIRTHLLTQLQGLHRFAKKEEQAVHVPEQALMELSRLRRGETELRDQLGRDPSDIELSDHVSLSRRRIQKLRAIKPAQAEGTISQAQSDAGGSSIGLTPIVSTPGTKAIQAWQDFVYHDLEPIDQVIMEHTLGMHGKPTLSNSAVAKKLRLSPSAISQRKIRIQEQLDTLHSTGVFGE